MSGKDRGLHGGGGSRYRTGLSIQIPLLTGKLTGNFLTICPRRRFSLHNCTQYQLFSRKFPTQRIRGRMQSTSRARSFNSTSLFWFRVPPQFAASLTPTNPEFASAVVANHASARALLPILKHAKSISAETLQGGFDLLRNGHEDVFASTRPQS